MNLTDQAHRMLDQGLHVFPLDHPGQRNCAGLHGPNNPCDGTRGKHPAVVWGTWAQTVTHKQIDLQWDKRRGLANIGVACGPSNLVILDEDAPGELEKWGAAYGIALPDTFTVSTGRGRHLYYRWDHAQRPIGNTAKAMRGFKIDVRGKGGYAVAEHSQHASGATYTGNGKPIVGLPDDVAELLLAGATEATESPEWETITAGPNAAKIGFRKRHEALVAYAGRLRKLGLDYAEALPVFRQRWELCEQPTGQIPEAKYHGTPPADCNYPVTWPEAQGKLRDVFDRYQAGITSPEDVVARVARVQWANEIRPERQVWLWENRIPVGTVSALAGRGGCGKTTWAIHLAAQVSRGELAGEHRGTPRPTLIWSGEDQWAPVLVPRLMAAGANLDFIGRLHIEAEDGIETTPRLPLDTATLREAITAAGAALVIIDPIASTMAGDLHREDDVRAALDALARVAADTGAVVMFVRHFGKGGGNASDKMSGSHAFRDAVRSVFLFAQDDESGHRIVTQDKGNYAPPGEESFAFRLESTTVPTNDGDAQVARVADLGVSEISVSDVINRPPAARTDDEGEDERDYTADLKASWLHQLLRDAGAANAPVRPKDALAYAADRGISRASVFRLFEKLTNAGMAVSKDTGKFPKVTRWELVDQAPATAGGETTDATHHSGETTETTGLDLRKQGETTDAIVSPVRLQGETTDGTLLDLRECGATEAGDTLESPVVSPLPGERQQTAPPGGLTATSPGQTDRVARALANAARRAVTA